MNRKKQEMEQLNRTKVQEKPNTCSRVYVDMEMDE